jgi:hypothetical protein
MSQIPFVTLVKPPSRQSGTCAKIACEAFIRFAHEFTSFGS